LCKQILAPQPLFFLINGYASGYSAITYGNNLEALLASRGGAGSGAQAGDLEMGELTIRESAGGRLLPCGIFARWRAV
jgi:23S rRNA (cytosine1962-C5)-methyltransferase